LSFFVETGSSDKEVIESVKRKYGEEAKIVSRREYKKGGLLGFFGKKVVELTGYAANQAVQKEPQNIEEKKNLLLKALQKKSSPTLQDVVRELRLLRNDIQTKKAEKEDNTATERVRGILESNECAPNFIADILERMRAALTLEELANAKTVDLCVLRWIAEIIEVQELSIKHKPQIIIVVGPTGVGKTTTIAKLAALYGVTRKPVKKARIITIDNYRIGANEQIQTYGDIMNIPVQSVESKEELGAVIQRFNNADMIFIDTIGKSPHDYTHLGEMRSLLGDYCTSAMVLLCISAPTKFSDAMHIIQQYSIFDINTIIVTKFDETTRVGSILSFIHESGKGVSFLTTGQKVPSDIEEVSAKSFLSRLSGFSLQDEDIRSTFEVEAKSPDKGSV